MRDWLRLADEAADDGNVIAVICFLEAEKVNSRLDHELEIADLRRQKEANSEDSMNAVPSRAALSSPWRFRT